MRLPVAVALFVAASHALALDALPGTRTIAFDGARLVHAAEGTTPVERWREFVPQGEKLDHWTKLASVREYPTHGDPRALAGELVRALKQRHPDAPSSIIENKATGEVIVDFVAWPADRAYTEFNVFRYGRREGGGVVAQQYALRAYGDATVFLQGLKERRRQVVDAMAKDGLRPAR